MSKITVKWYTFHEHILYFSKKNEVHRYWYIIYNSFCCTLLVTVFTVYVYILVFIFISKCIVILEVKRVQRGNILGYVRFEVFTTVEM
jgi:hypothetical protein